MPSKFLEQFRAARIAGTPLIAIRTSDQVATTQLITEFYVSKNVPHISWDVVHGWTALDDAGSNVIKALQKASTVSNDIKDETRYPLESLLMAEKLPRLSVLFMMNMHRYLVPHEPAIAQQLCNLREILKPGLRSLVMLGPDFDFPAELKQDIFVIDQPLPTEAELAALIKELTLDKIEPTLDDPSVDRIVDATRGLSSFSAEQVVAMAIKEDRTIDHETLWERKREMIELEDGLSVWRDGMTFSDIGGITQAKGFFSEYLQGQTKPRCVVFIDEIEKTSVGGGLGDTSGTSLDQLQVLLTAMQENRWPGSLFFGHPGVAKTALAKAIGNEAKIPTIYLDLGAMKGSLVGESEKKVRQAIKVIKAIAGENALFIGTCNEISGLKPELRRRFGLPTFFFDLPDNEERRVIWDIYGKKFGIDTTDFVDDRDWTGAEIERCAWMAWNLRKRPSEVEHYVIPIAKSSSKEIESRRREASHKYLDSSKKGLYVYDEPKQKPASISGKRNISNEL